jgi:hypothetical protein
MPGRIYSTLVILTLTFFTCNSPKDELVYDYYLVDVNPNSDTYGTMISPSYFENEITLHYFGHQY